MSSSGLANAAEDRKARLAALKSLKRKQPEPDTDEPTTDSQQDQQPRTKSPKTETGDNNNNNNDEDSSAPNSTTTTTPTYLSGRNYDPQTRGPKFGFESNPADAQETLEKKASALAEETRLQAERDAAEDKPLDLFKLQPKKPNWDLKRDLQRKLDVLDVRTENAIARLVRERIAGQQQQQQQQKKEMPSARNGDEERLDVGMEGAMFVEATREREREDEDEARRDRLMDQELLDAT